MIGVWNLFHWDWASGVSAHVVPTARMLKGG
jgi:hypothetical protein